MTVFWWTYLSFNPNMIAYAMTKTSYSGERVRETKKVILTIPSEEIADEVMQCGMSTGRVTDKVKESLPYKHFLGYKRGEDGLSEIVLEEAEIVRLICRSFMNGMTPYRIAKILTEKDSNTCGKGQVAVIYH